MTNNVQNILDTYNASTSYEVAAGASWYTEAHEFCLRLSRLYNIPRDNVVAVCAVLSPRVTWAACCSATIKVLESWRAGTYEVSGIPGLHINKEKAYRILDNDDPNYLGGDKVKSFYQNISDPNSPDYVTVDVWARRVCEGDHSLPAASISEKAYLNYKDAYCEAAGIIGLLPSELQAITWVTIRRQAKYGSRQLPLF